MNLHLILYFSFCSPKLHFLAELENFDDMKRYKMPCPYSSNTQVCLSFFLIQRTHMANGKHISRKVKEWVIKYVVDGYNDRILRRSYVDGTHRKGWVMVIKQGGRKRDETSVREQKKTPNRRRANPKKEIRRKEQEGKQPSDSGRPLRGGAPPNPLGFFC